MKERPAEFASTVNIAYYDRLANYRTKLFVHELPCTMSPARLYWHGSWTGLLEPNNRWFQQFRLLFNTMGHACMLRVSTSSHPQLVMRRLFLLTYSYRQLSLKLLPVYEYNITSIRKFKTIFVAPTTYYEWIARFYCNGDDGANSNQAGLFFWYVVT